MNTLSAQKIFLRIATILLGMTLILTAAMMEVHATDDHGRDAHSESMTVGPDGTAEGAVSEPEGYKPSVDVDELEPEGEPEPISLDNEERPIDEETDEKTETEKEQKEDGWMDSRILAAMIAAGVTIVVCEFIKSKINK